MPIGVGMIQELESDYKKSSGIGAAIPTIAGLSDVLASIQSSASQIVAVAKKHTRTLQEISILTQEHIVHTFPHARNASR
jgi:hypothetical protein